MRQHDDPSDPDFEPLFLRFTDTGKVHVFKNYRLFGEVLMEPGDEVTMVQVLMAPQRAWCGACGPPGVLCGISAFPDEDLCWSCRKAFPGSLDEQSILFEHPQL